MMTKGAHGLLITTSASMACFALSRIALIGSTRGNRGWDYKVKPMTHSHLAIFPFLAAPRVATASHLTCFTLLAASRVTAARAARLRRRHLREGNRERTYVIKGQRWRLR